MAVEIGEMIVRTTITSTPRGSGECGNDMEEIRQEVLATCKEWLAEFLSRQKDR